MDRSSVIYLVALTWTTDTIGNPTAVESPREVFCNIQSVSRSEFFEAGQYGLKPEYKVTMFEPDYQGEDLVKINSEYYSVYRTYIRQDEQIELYLTKKANHALPPV